MEYSDFIKPVEDLGFVGGPQEADAAVKAVLGILANRLSEDDARDLTDKLPEPLTKEKLRSRQYRPLDISVDQYVTEVGTQFNVNEHQAHELVDTVLHAAHQCVGDEIWNELREHLPGQWRRTLEKV